MMVWWSLDEIQQSFMYGVGWDVSVYDGIYTPEGGWSIPVRLHGSVLYHEDTPVIAGPHLANITCRDSHAKQTP